MVLWPSVVRRKVPSLVSGDPSRGATGDVDNLRSAKRRPLENQRALRWQFWHSVVSPVVCQVFFPASIVSQTKHCCPYPAPPPCTWIYQIVHHVHKIPKHDYISFSRLTNVKDSLSKEKLSTDSALTKQTAKNRNKD